MEGLSNILPFAFTIIIGLFILFGFIVGLIRGLKRSVARLIWIIACIVILLLTTTLITPAFLNADISFMNLSYKGQTASTIKEYTGILVSSITETPVEELGTTMDFAIAVSSMFVNSFVFALMFLLLRFITLPLYAIINKIFFHDRNKKKKRIFGALVGTVTGLLIAVTFLMPLSGYVTLYDDVKKTLADTEYADEFDDADKFFNVYKNDFTVKILDSIGLKSIQLFMFDAVSQSKYGDSNFRLMKEKDDLLAALPSLMELESDSNQGENLDPNALIEPLSYLFSSEILRAAFVEFAPIIKEKIQNADLGTEEYIGQVKDLIIDVIDKLPELDKATVRETLRVVADASAEAKKISDKNECNYRLLGEQIDKLISLDVVSGEKINNLMYSIAEHTLGSIKEDDPVYEISKNILAKLKSGVKSYAKEMAALSIVFDMSDMLDDDFDFTEKGAELGAKINQLLAVKAEIIDKKFVDDLISSAIDDYAKGSLSGDFNSYTDDIKSNLKKVKNYQAEFTYLSKLIELSSSDYSIEHVNEPDENGKTLGNKLDEIASSVLVGSIPLDVIGKQLNEYAASPENAEYKDILDVIKANYDAVCEKSVANGYANGFTYSDITSAFGEMYKAMTTAESKIVGNSEFNTEITKATEDELAKLAENVLLGESGARLVAIAVADDISDYINKKPVLAASPSGRKVIDKLNVYKQYLRRASKLEKEPYNEDKDVYADKDGNRAETYSDGYTRINRPFTYLLEELQSIIG